MTSLEKRLTALETGAGGPAGIAIVVANSRDETVDAAAERHFAEHPQERDRVRLIVVDTGIYRTPGGQP